ncbi:MAG: phosphomannomutase/phosphoglucomutase [Gammaproteobacteria bacterium]
MIKSPSAANLPANLSKSALIIVGIVLLAVVLATVGISTVYQKVDVANRQVQLEANQVLADNLAVQLGTVYEPQRLKLKSLAQKPTIVAALATDKATRDKTAAAIQSMIPGALLLRMLPGGTDHIDPSAKPPLTFASVDMLHGASTSDEEISIELHFSGTENEHVVMIQRVPISGPVVGFLHLSLDSKSIKTAALNHGAKHGEVEVRQPMLKAPPLIIAKSGSTTDADFPAAIAGIRGTKWVVSYRFAPPGTAAGSILAMLPTVVGSIVLAGLVLVLVGLVRVRTNREVVLSVVTYQGAIKSILEGGHPGLEQLLPGVAGGGAVDFGPISEGLNGDDITTFSTPSAPANVNSEDTTIPLSVNVTKDVAIDVDNTQNLEASVIDRVTEADPSIFRSYDIRGIVGETLTIEGVYEIGRALGSEAHARDQQSIVTARDGRNSSQEIRDALIAGLRDSGRDVLDIGLTPTPVLYFATHYLDTRSGVMITGSHNPPEYNGLKIVLDGETLSGDAIQAIRTRVETQDYTVGEGTMRSVEIIPHYIRRVSEEIPVSLGKALKVVVDCGNSVPGIVAPHILRASGHEVIELYCEVDGDFPNNHPDPSQPDNLIDLIQTVQDEDADLGLAFDGDGDRLGVVDTQGNIIWPDRQMILFARDVLSRNPGAKIIYDVKCSRLLAEEIKKNGGEAIMARTGHSLIKSEMLKTGALLAGEMSGHIFFKERWYGFDDALYSAARLLEILAIADESPDEVFARLPGGIATPELRLDMPENEHATFMRRVSAAARFDDGEVTTIDGLRADFSDSWGLIRASNTTPCLVLRFEGDNEAALEGVKARFKALLTTVDANLDLPF